MKSHHIYDLSLFSIFSYATTHTEESVYIISGMTSMNHSPRKTSIIAQYKDDNWSIAGNLKQPRSSHGAITIQGMTVIIGGFPEKGST